MRFAGLPSALATSSSFLRSRPAMATLAPSCRSACADAAPMPDPPPVTRAILLVSFAMRNPCDTMNSVLNRSVSLGTIFALVPVQRPHGAMRALNEDRGNEDRLDERTHP